MRRVLFASLVAGFALVVAAACGRQPDPPPATASTHTVTVLFQCERTRLVSPWVVRVRPGDNIEWVLDTLSDVDAFEVSRKHWWDGWPFAGGSKHPGSKGAPAAARNARGKLNKPYHYKISAQCPDGSGGTKETEIDPDIILDT